MVKITEIDIYRLLGWSAFAGLLVLVVGWPLNNFVAKRAMRIQKGMSNARDKRMGVINELISAVRSFEFLRVNVLTRVLSSRIGQVHQVLRMGGSLDCARPRRPRD